MYGCIFDFASSSSENCLSLRYELKAKADIDHVQTKELSSSKDLKVIDKNTNEVVVTFDRSDSQDIFSSPKKLKDGGYEFSIESARFKEYKEVSYFDLDLGELSITKKQSIPNFEGQVKGNKIIIKIADKNIDRYDMHMLSDAFNKIYIL